MGGAAGERTDILVQASIGSDAARETVTVTIEVKGEWTAELHTAMETQLLNRYMAENDCSHGLYLVGWYHCPQWNDPDDRRKRVRAGITKDELVESLEKHARSLSGAGSLIRALVLDLSLRH